MVRRKRGRTTISVPGVRVADDLVGRQFRPAVPNQLWVAEITYLRTWEGWLYLAAVQDAYTRAIVGWSMAEHMRAELVVDALQMAVTRRRPKPGLIDHSDQGSQYVSLAFGHAAREAGIREVRARTTSVLPARSPAGEGRRVCSLRRMSAPSVLPRAVHQSTGGGSVTACRFQASTRLDFRNGGPPHTLAVAVSVKSTLPAAGFHSAAPILEPQRLSAELVGRKHIVQAWRETTSAAFVCEPLAPERFDASLVAYNLDGLLISRARFDASRYARTAEMLRGDGNDGVVIALYLTGSIRGQIGEHELRMAPDRIALQDLSVECSALAEASDVLSVVITRNRITSPELLRARRPVLAFSLGTARGSLLARALNGIWEDLCAGRVAQPVVVAGAFMGLVNGLIEYSVDRAGAGDPLLRMERYLRDHLSDPTLGHGHLQHAFHYSRSAIYRLFERHGGVAAFIRSERLLRCHAEIIRSTSATSPVSAVAARYGFYDHSHFSRVFRDEYGVAPSHLAATAARRAVGGAETSATSCASVIRAWMQGT